MLREDINNILATHYQGTGYKLLNDIDGPGRGNAAIIIREERPKEGGIYLFLLNYKYPYKGSPYLGSVENLGNLKKTILCAVKSISNLQTKIYLAVLSLLPRILTRGIISSAVNYYYLLMGRFLEHDFIKPERYCICVREIYRTLTVLTEREKEEWVKKIIEIVREIFCMFIELDSAYKFRFQDIILELKTEEIRGKKRMIKEVERLFDIMISRERPQFPEGTNAEGMVKKWRRMKKFAILLLKRVKLARKIMEDFFQEVDLKKMYPDKGDRYFDLLRRDYDFFGKPYPIRMQERKRIEGENWKYFEKLANYFLQEFYGEKKKFNN